MSVTEQTPISVATGNNVTTVFAYQFKILLNTDIAVETGGLLRTLNVDYTVTGVGVDAGGTIVFTVPPVAGVQVNMYRKTAAARATDYQTNGDFLTPQVNADYDRLWLKIQELVSDLNRALLAPRGSAALILPAAAVGQFLRWRTDLLGLENASITALGALGLPVSVANGGTSASTQSQAIQNLGFIDIKSETQLNAGGVLDATSYGRAYSLVDSGSPANYTITLPTGAPVGTLLQFRVGQNGTKLYTIAGSDVGIDGSPSRVLWRGESCLLYREGANWTKLGGKTVPFRGILQRLAAQSISSGATFQKCLLTSENGDTYGLNLCFDSTNNRFVAPRQGSFSFVGYASIAATVTVSASDTDLALSTGSNIATSTPGNLARASYAVGAPRVILTCAGNSLSFTAGGFVELLGRIQNGTIASPSFEYVAGLLTPSLSYAEHPLW